MEKATEIKVWDLFVRVFHWVLVVGFFTAYLVEDEMLGLHVWSGYLVFSLVVLRIIWGFIGSKHARFSDFVFGPSDVFSYVKQVTTFKATRHIGHNPAGGAMIVLLLLGVLMISFTGFVLLGAETQSGLAGDLALALGIAGEHAAEAVEELHEFFANLILLLVFIHIGGVVFDSFLHKESLIRSMFTGLKRQE